MKKALITGITGQDGSYLGRFLLEKGYEVNGLIGTGEHAVCRNLDFLGISDRVNLIQTDLLHFEAIVDLLDKVKPDEIYHLAAQSSVANSFSDPLNTIHFNILGTHHLLEAIRRLDMPARYYQASSSEMYGRVEKAPRSRGQRFTSCQSICDIEGRRSLAGDQLQGSIRHVLLLWNSV